MYYTMWHTYIFIYDSLIYSEIKRERDGIMYNLNSQKPYAMGRVEAQ